MEVKERNEFKVLQEKYQFGFYPDKAIFAVQYSTAVFFNWLFPKEYIPNVKYIHMYEYIDVNSRARTV